MHIVNNDALEDYLSEMRRVGTLPLIIDAKEWANFMEDMLEKYHGRVTLDTDQVSPEGIEFLKKFWFYGKLL